MVLPRSSAPKDKDDQMIKDDLIKSNRGSRAGEARPWRAAVLVAALAVAAMLVAACGGGSHAPGSGSNPDQDLAVAMDSFASCMRSHGDPSFYFTHQTGTPSPPASGTGLFMDFHGYTAEFDPNSRAFEAAQKTCKHLLPFSGGLTGTGNGETHQQFLQALKVVSCMHSHGYPNWPDPNAKVGGGIEWPVGVDTSTPQFQAADKTCRLGAPPGG
jgi:hypothetical protein